MKINGIVYLLVGGFVVGFSYYISSVSAELDVQKFYLFIWLGILFIAIGIMKILISIITRQRKPKIAKENFPNMHSQNNQSSQFVKFCSKCGSAVRHFDNFCYKCGSRVFHRK